MSSFICNPSHFNSIEEKLINLITFKNDFYLPYSLRNVLPKCKDRLYSSLTEMENEIKSVMDELRKLNVVCVSLQYKDHYQGVLDREIEEQTSLLMSDKTTKKDLSVHGLYNALRCLDYQIETEHLIDIFGMNEGQNNAMLFLNEIINELAAYIISNLPEDNTNTWSIEI